ncbi:YabP family protein [Alkaliphilus metalliredigens QYMF]|uniref:YabP family protein n=1 Tax=Alkaliphilus metalliredigens (strain QYMF) TaxID=293826 RepID=A6TJN8_ALKMQ|nr:sporulation protein YabP [Alkaliphilus metalliredigens]ABR46406.1 YabP family protein [Alkaliphilus metalliredigens QYMF]
MEERKKTNHRGHSLILENREKLSISGVEHVNSFNSELIVVETIDGVLTLKGEDLDVSKLSLDDGNASIQGRIYSMIYSDRSSLGTKGSGLLSKMFK